MRKDYLPYVPIEPLIFAGVILLTLLIVTGECTLARGEDISDMSPLYRSRFLGHGCCRIRPALWVATFGDRRSSANCGRRILRATPQNISWFWRSPSSCGLRPGQQVSTHLRR